MNILAIAELRRLHAIISGVIPASQITIVIYNIVLGQCGHIIDSLSSKQALLYFVWKL